MNFPVPLLKGVHCITSLLFISILSAAADKAQPDFIFFLTDDISAGDLAVYREDRPKLPNIQRLAERGMVFENFYVATSSCSPSRSSFITGRYPHNHGAPGLHQPLPTGQVMFPAVLQRAGYYTALAGKNHMGPQPGKHAFSEVFKGEGVSRSEDWVSIYRNRPGDRPCFLWLASDDAHRDWQPDANFRKPDLRSVTVPPYLFDDGETRGDLANYEAEVGRTDYYLGQLLDEVERAGRLDSTYVIYTSDNGRPFPRCKTHLYDSGTRVPFIISGPGIPRGTRAGTLASAIDLAATICELAGVESPRTKRFQGASMVPVLRDPALSHRSVVFAERNWHITRAHERMVREGPWMYIWNAWPDSRVYGPESNVYFPAGKSLRAAFEKGLTKPHQNFPYIWPRPTEQLFHVGRDPDQLENLADNSFYTPVLQRLQKHLSTWKEETGDSVPESKNEAGKAGPGPGADRNAPAVNKPGPCAVDAGGIFLTEADDSVRFDWGELRGPRYEALKPGAVHPEGWLRDQLETMADGLTGNLDNAYESVVGDRNGWLGGDGDGWERGPYWIDGLLPLAYLLQEEKLLARSNRWVEWTLLNQREDGYIGPIPFESPPEPEPGLQKDRRRDWWPKMVMLKILQQHYLATGDERVLTCLDRYFRFQLRELPKTPLGHWSYWATRRAGDNIHIVHWLYSLTREPYLLELSDLLIKQGYPWTRDFADGDKVKEFRHTVHHGSGSGYHCVNLAHALKTPVLEWQRDGDKRAVEALDNGIRLIREYHGQPHSLWGGDEGMHGTSPNRGSEFCTASEALYSLALNFANTGRVDFADWSERVVYNVLKTQANAAFTRRQYFQQANQIDCSIGEHPFLNHHRSANVFGLLSGYPCCTCNMHQAWPKFATHLWMKSADGGVAAFSYAPSTVTVPIQGKTVRITTVTSYPRRDEISLSISTGAGAAVEFPVHLRIPGWAHGAHVSVNGKTAGYPQAATMAVIKRAWTDGDVINLVLPSEVSVTRGHLNAASVHKGPLLFALPLPAVEKELADREVTELRLQDDKVIWNYALFEKDLNPRPVRLRKFQVSDNGKDNIRIQCYAVKQPRWTSYHGESGPLPPSPSDFPNGQLPAKIELVPYADTRLRISVFPTVN